MILGLVHRKTAGQECKMCGAIIYTPLPPQKKEEEEEKMWLDLKESRHWYLSEKKNLINFRVKAL